MDTLAKTVCLDKPGNFLKNRLRLLVPQRNTVFLYIDFFSYSCFLRIYEFSLKMLFPSEYPAKQLGKY